MFDGSELGRAIAAHPDDVEAAVFEYEDALFPRSKEFAADSDRNHKFLFGDDTREPAQTAHRPRTGRVRNSRTWPTIHEI
jgi:hypothetical protein